MNIHIHRRLLIWPLALVIVTLLAAGLWMLNRQPKTDIRAETPGIENFAAGKTVQGRNLGSAKELKTNSELTYEAPVRQTKSPKTNAVGLIWDQTGSSGTAEAQVRTNDGSGWSEWASLGGGDDLKDGATAHTGIVLTKNAHQAQYRFIVKAGADGTSPVVKSPRVSLIDSTRGPDPTKPTPLAKLLGQNATAAAEGPRIYGRTEWGCPDGDASPGWPPDYRVPDEVIVHHTAATASPDSAAAVRAIWQQHARTNNWGDIGYNYLVDLNGNIFQGRYYNQTIARQTNQDVVGGHTLNGHNYHSVGVAALGHFTNQGVSGGLLDGIAKIAGWKAMPYGTWNPGGRMIGHRDADSTNCPGNNLYNALGTVRNAASYYFDFYSRWQRFDYSYQGQGVNGAPGGSLSLRPGETTTAYLDLRNEGTDPWSNQQIRLGTSNPLDRGSGFRHSSWLSPNRVGTFAGKVVNGSVQAATTIAPGETARWQFTVGNQGADNGTYREYFQPVVEGSAWFVRNIGIHWLMSSVGDVYSYQWITQTYGVPTEPGQTGTVSVDAKNTGNVNWSNTGPNPIHLGTNRPRDRLSSLYDSSWINSTRPATYAGQLNGGVLDGADGTIEPGATARFTFTVRAPTHAVVGNEYFNLVAEGKAWMNDVGMSWPVNTPQNYHAQFVDQSAAPTISKSVPDNGIGSMSFDYKNTGTYPWRKGQIVRLGTANPLDRASRFFATGLGGLLPANTTNWDSANRTGSFAGKVTGGSFDNTATVINPGQTGRFMIALDARTVNPGTYHEYIRPVADGFAWLEDYGVFLDVTVTP